MKTEEIMRLSTDILCALIGKGLLPKTTGDSVNSAATMTRDYLHAISQEVRNVHSLLDEE